MGSQGPKASSADIEDSQTGPDAQAEPSRWANRSFVGFVVLRLNLSFPDFFLSFLPARREGCVWLRRGGAEYVYLGPVG